jgi:hypothetical protein
MLNAFAGDKQAATGGAMGNLLISIRPETLV